MKREISISGSLDAIRHSSDFVSIKLVVPARDAGSLILNLLLLDYGLVEFLQFTPNGSGKSLAISIAKDSPCLTTPLHVEKMRIQLSRDSLQAIIGFFLQYVRDGYWMANHIDIELLSDLAQGQNICFTVETDETARAIPADLLKRRLGME